MNNNRNKMHIRVSFPDRNNIPRSPGLEYKNSFPSSSFDPVMYPSCPPLLKTSGNPRYMQQSHFALHGRTALIAYAARMLHRRPAHNSLYALLLQTPRTIHRIFFHIFPLHARSLFRLVPVFPEYSRNPRPYAPRTVTTLPHFSSTFITSPRAVCQ